MQSLAPRVNSRAVALPLDAHGPAVRPPARRLQWPLFTLGLMLVDATLAGLAFRLAYLVRFELPLGVFQADAILSKPYYQLLVVFMTLGWLAVFSGFGLYSRANLLGGAQEYALVFRANAVCLLVVIVASFLEPALVIARGWLLLAWLFTFALIGLGRFGMRRVGYALRRRGLFLSQAVIVGANREGVSLARQWIDQLSCGLRLVGFVDEKVPAGTPVVLGLPCLGSVDDLDQVIDHYGVEEIVLASSAVSSREHLMRVFQRYGLSRTVNLRMSSGLYEIITTGLSVREFAYVPLFGVNKVRLTGFDQALKFALDYAITIPGLLLISPLLLCIAIAIRLDSPGPVLYRRGVMGVNGSRFGALKFRTMALDGDAILARHPELQRELAQNQKLKHDPRVTRVGRFLRRTSLDELPQLFNVLRREMSLVGPRMISPAEMALYGQWGINLLTVKPGITGLWQVSGRSDVSYEERIQLDMFYIRNWSLWLDLQLLWQTVPTVLRGTGAY
jgi:exopolysaccharide biosynthesis polyprenyl glycosylphosphotransferase